PRQEIAISTAAGNHLWSPVSSYSRSRGSMNSQACRSNPHERCSLPNDDHSLKVATLTGAKLENFHPVSTIPAADCLISWILNQPEREGNSDALSSSTISPGFAPMFSRYSSASITGRTDPVKPKAL